MLGLTDNEMKSRFDCYEDLRRDETRLHFPRAEAPSIRVDFRVQEPHQFVYLARLLASLGYDTRDFVHAELWVTAWGIWDDRDQAVGLKALEQFRRSYGETRSLEAAPGHYFRHDEFVESVCCLLQPVLVGWDAYYVPHWAYGSLDYFLSVSHDGFIDVEIRTREMYNRAMQVLQNYEWIKPLLKAES